MQIMIDTAQDMVHLRRIAAMLLVLDDYQLAEAYLPTVGAAPKPIKAPTPPAIGTPAPASAPAPLPSDNVPPPPVEHPKVHPDVDKFVPPTPPDVPAGTQDALPPPSVFGGSLPLGSTQDANAGFAAPGSAPPAPTGALPATMTPGAGTDGAPFVPAPPVAAVPSAASAPIVTASAAPPVPGAAPVGGERDSKGYLWDARIHSETKKKNADGTWRFRRNLDDTVKTAVLAELNAARGGGAPAPTFQPPAGVAGTVPVPPAPPAVPVPPASTVAVPVPPVPAAGGVPVPPAPGGGSNVVTFPNQAPTAPPVPVPTPANVGMPNPGLPDVVSSFRELIQLVNVSISKGAMTQAQLAEACAHVKVESITGLASQPPLVPDIYKYMRDRNWLLAAV